QHHQEHGRHRRMVADRGDRPWWVPLHAVGEDGRRVGVALRRPRSREVERRLCEGPRRSDRAQRNMGGTAVQDRERHRLMPERKPTPLKRVWEASIWHPNSIPPSEFKYRNLKRVWLPLYDLVAVWAGVNAIMFGSQLLDRLFTPAWVDLLGAVFTTVAIICLVSVSFPCLWGLEVVGKVLLVGMIAGYITTIVFFS